MLPIMRSQTTASFASLNAKRAREFDWCVALSQYLLLTLVVGGELEVRLSDVALLRKQVEDRNAVFVWDTMDSSGRRRRGG
jgi:hypothetical protein